MHFMIVPLINNARGIATGRAGGWDKLLDNRKEKHLLLPTEEVPLIFDQKNSPQQSAVYIENYTGGTDVCVR